MEFMDLVHTLQAGGDAALIVGAYLFWKIERRLFRLETVLEIHLKEHAKDEE